jgi:hypothetical protein
MNNPDKFCENELSYFYGLWAEKSRPLSFSCRMVARVPVITIFPNGQSDVTIEGKSSA